MIDVEDRNGVAVLRMRHGKANALDAELCRRLAEEFGALRTAPVRSVVLTGQGRIFCAGVDLVRITEEGPDYTRQFLEMLHGVCEAIFAFPKPVVAAIAGHAVGGGFILACMADRRIMARGGGRVGLPEMQVGLPFPPGLMEILRFAVPPRQLARMIYSGAAFEPGPALDRGLIDEVLDPDELLGGAVAAANALGDIGHDTFRLTKAQIRQSALEQMRARQREIGAEVERIWTAPETISRVRQYVERTLKQGRP